VLETGADAYLRKPFLANELFAEMGNFLGLCYVYADQPANHLPHSQPALIVPETLAALPGELVDAMKQAVTAGDMDLLTELIAQLEKIDRPMAHGLQLLADRYDYKRLAKWLVKGNKNDE
jgi:DNA-binding response OmpR family regulator